MSAVGSARSEASASGARALGATPFVWGARIDLLAFLGSALFALALVAAGHALGVSEGPLPEWAWLAFVLAIDVAHVWSTLFRTYLDREEVARRRALYLGLPAGIYVAGALLHAASPLAFWRTLAYLAVFHFVRQQAGWVAIYRARAGQSSRTVDRIIDDLAIYAATGVPLFIWHARLPRAFSWFLHGDFVGSPSLGAFVPAAKGILLFALLLFFGRQLQVAIATRLVNVGKVVIVATTAAIWWIGIVATDSDFDFTVTNVIVHGVPYLVLLWHYARRRSEDAPRALGSRILAHGIGAFIGLLVALAFLEEMLWDRFVWHDRPWLFGGEEAIAAGASIVGSAHAMPTAASWVLTLVVPLLALPQATHYALDAFLWRRRDTGKAQARALGFVG